MRKKNNPGIKNTLRVNVGPDCPGLNQKEMEGRTDRTKKDRRGDSKRSQVVGKEWTSIAIHEVIREGIQD